MRHGLVFANRLSQRVDLHRRYLAHNATAFSGLPARNDGRPAHARRHSLQRPPRANDLWAPPRLLGYDNRPVCPAQEVSRRAVRGRHVRAESMAATPASESEVRASCERDGIWTGVHAGTVSGLPVECALFC